MKFQNPNLYFFEWLLAGTHGQAQGFNLARFSTCIFSQVEFFATC